jgi:prolyl-tRNA synthetase
MRLSEYFLPLLRENPSEAQIVSHRLMLRGGMIRQSSAASARTARLEKGRAGRA